MSLNWNNVVSSLFPHTNFSLSFFLLCSHFSSPQLLFHTSGAPQRFKLQMILLQPLVCLCVYSVNKSNAYPLCSLFNNLNILCYPLAGHSHIFRPQIVKSVARPTSPSPFSSDAPLLSSVPPLPKSPTSSSESGNWRQLFLFLIFHRFCSYFSVFLLCLHPENHPSCHSFSFSRCSRSKVEIWLC